MPDGGASIWLPMLIGGGISAGGSIAGAAMGSSAAKDAANLQSSAADRAAQLQYQASQNSLDFAKQVYGQQQQNMAPFLRVGQQAAGTLGSLMGFGPAAAPAAAPAPAPAPLPGGGRMAMYGAGPSGGVTGMDNMANAIGGNVGAALNLSSPISGPMNGGGTMARYAQKKGTHQRIQWPDGSQASVPMQDLSHYINLGADVADPNTAGNA